MNKERSELMAVRDYIMTLLSEDNDDIIITGSGTSLVELEADFSFNHNDKSYFVTINDMSYRKAS
jgi:hypothetical protein